jgi:hypothetical protein
LRLVEVRRIRLGKGSNVPEEVVAGMCSTHEDDITGLHVWPGTRCLATLAHVFNGDKNKIIRIRLL